MRNSISRRVRGIPGSLNRPSVSEEALINLAPSQRSVRADEAQTTEGHSPRERRIISFVLMGGVLLLAMGGSYYYAYTQSFASTNDAFIAGDVTDLAPKVAGRVDRVFIDDNQQVKKGDLLIAIDPRDYDAALRQKQANLDSFKAQAAAVEAVVLALSMAMFGSLNLDIAPANVIWPIVISGFGIPSIFVPMTTFSVATVGKAEMADATGITSLVRNLGGSVGISLITTFVTRGTQTHQALLVSHLVPHNHVYLDRLNQMEAIVAPHSGAITAHSQAYGLMYETLRQQAALWSYIDQFRLLAVVSLLLAPIIFLYRKSPSPPK